MPTQLKLNRQAVIYALGQAAIRMIALLGMFALGMFFQWLIERERDKEQTKSEIQNVCTGYTVVDAHHVELCDGSIVKKDWQIKIN